EAIRGPAGGYRLAGGYRTKLTGLTGAEAEALFVAPAPAAELGLGGVLANARLKVLAALPAELQERASRAERYFHLDTRGWFRAEDTVPHLPALAAATWQGKRLNARYREGRKVVQRTLDPLGLVLKGGAWYLVARRSAGMRVYRVSRFASVHVRDEGFQRPVRSRRSTLDRSPVASLRCRLGRPPQKAGAEAMEPQNSVRVLGSFFVVPSWKERHVRRRDEALSGKRAGECARRPRGPGVGTRDHGTDGRPEVLRPARDVAAHDAADPRPRRIRLRRRPRVRRLLDPRLAG